MSLQFNELPMETKEPIQKAMQLLANRLIAAVRSAKRHPKGVELKLRLKNEGQVDGIKVRKFYLPPTTLSIIQNNIPNDTEALRDSLSELFCNNFWELIKRGKLSYHVIGITITVFSYNIKLDPSTLSLAKRFKPIRVSTFANIKYETTEVVMEGEDVPQAGPSNDLAQRVKQFFMNRKNSIVEDVEMRDENQPGPSNYKKK